MTRSRPHGNLRLQGTCLSVEKTEKSMVENEVEWHRCVLTVELTNFSKRASGEDLPNSLLKKRLKLVRWCSADWHYYLTRVTLDAEETMAVLVCSPMNSVYW